MNVSNWKEFKIKNLFELKRGKSCSSHKIKPGNIPLINGGASNNGVSNYIDSQDTLSNIITIARTGSTGVSFYQKNAVFIGENAIALIPKFELNEYIGMFLITILNHMNKKYSYGYPITIKKYGENSIFLPITYDSEPDWEFMENYMKEISESIDMPKFKNNNLNINIHEWKTFNVENLFNIKRGKALSLSNLVDGEYKYISACSLNNGASANCDTFNNNGNIITIALNGSVGTSFYQEDKTYVNGDVAMLELKPVVLNKEIALFLCVIFELETANKFNYGRKLSLSKLKDLTINLPVELDGEPDWEFMENYMKEFITE